MKRNFILPILALFAVVSLSAFAPAPADQSETLVYVNTSGNLKRTVKITVSGHQVSMRCWTKNTQTNQTTEFRNTVIHSEWDGSDCDLYTRVKFTTSGEVFEMCFNEDKMIRTSPDHKKLTFWHQN